MFETTNHLWWSYSDFMVISMFSGVFVVIYDYLLWFNVDFYADWVGFTRGNDDFGRCVYDVFYADWMEIERWLNGDSMIEHIEPVWWIHCDLYGDLMGLTKKHGAGHDMLSG